MLKNSPQLGTYCFVHLFHDMWVLILVKLVFGCHIKWCPKFNKWRLGQVCYCDSHWVKSGNFKLIQYLKSIEWMGRGTGKRVEEKFREGSKSDSKDYCWNQKRKKIIEKVESHPRALFHCFDEFWWRY